MSCADGHTNASLLVQLTGLAKQLNILIFDDSKNQAANDQDDLDSSKKNELKLLMKPQEIVNFYNSIDKTENSSFDVQINDSNNLSIKRIKSSEKKDEGPRVCLFKTTDIKKMQVKITKINKKSFIYQRIRMGFITNQLNESQLDFLSKLLDPRIGKLDTNDNKMFSTVDESAICSDFVYWHHGSRNGNKYNHWEKDSLQIEEGMIITMEKIETGFRFTDDKNFDFDIPFPVDVKDFWPMIQLEQGNEVEIVKIVGF